MGKYFEDLSPGDSFVTPARTVTEADIVLYAGLSGDHNPIHTDYELCAKTPFGRPIAHGLLTVSILQGLLERTGVQEGTIVALRRITNMEFDHPVFAGDTLHGEIRVVAKEERKSTGLVQFEAQAVNQRQETVVRMSYEIVLRRRPAA